MWGLCVVHLVFGHTSKARSCVAAGASTAPLSPWPLPSEQPSCQPFPVTECQRIHSAGGKHRHQLFALSTGGAGSDDSPPATLGALLLLLFICVVALPGNIPRGREPFAGRDMQRQQSKC